MRVGTRVTQRARQFRRVLVDADEERAASLGVLRDDRQRLLRSGRRFLRRRAVSDAPPQSKRRRDQRQLYRSTYSACFTRLS